MIITPSSLMSFRLLEEMANTVYESHTNEHVLFKFLKDLHAMLDAKTVWGGHLGSETLMRRHKNTRTRIACITVLEKRKSELEQRKAEDAGTSIEELPEEVGRSEIVSKLMINEVSSVCQRNPVQTLGPQGCG